MRISTFAVLSSALLLAACVNVNTSDHSNHDAMTMDQMVSMLDGKLGHDFDCAFVTGMIPHHQGAIDMAELALEQSGREEMKTLARDIIASQQREIDQMNGWLAAWSCPQQ